MQISLNNFTKTFDGTAVIENMNLDIRSGELLALLGPSGCGKSTTLLAISGIHRVNGGHIMFGNRDVSDLPSQKRNVGVVFQNYALYPHMTAFENIAFPLQVRGAGKTAIEKKVREMAGLVHIEPYLERRPGQLSGGQQQRVALARALVREPDVLLLDEPLANLDAKLRLEMRSEIRRIQLETGITAILVTHDQVEAMSMSDRIAIMDGGRIIQIAQPEEMYQQPATQFVAEFLGNPPIVFLEGHAANDNEFVSRSGLQLPLPSRIAGLAPDQPITVGIRPEHFGTTGSHTVRGTVTFIEPQGRETHFDLKVGEGEILRSVQNARTDITLDSQIEWPLDVERTLVFNEKGATL